MPACRWTTTLVVFVATCLVCSGYWYFRSTPSNRVASVSHHMYTSARGRFGSGTHPRRSPACAARLVVVVAYPWVEDKKSGYSYSMGHGLDRCLRR